MNTQMLAELLEHLAVARGDEAVRVLVVSSADHLGLSAGADVREQLDDEAKVRAHAALRRPLRPVVAFPKPTIAACHGDVVGGGAEIAIACDMRVGGSNLRMRFPGAALGVPVGPARLVTLCGLATAKYLLLTSRTVGADEALRLGSSTASPRRRDRGRGAGARRRSRRPPARGGRPAEADAARVGRRRRPLRRRGPRPGRGACARRRACPLG